MLSRSEIIEAWVRGKSGRQFHRLAIETEIAWEYRGPQFGHPSNYAAVRVLAKPASDFSLDSSATYPPSVSAPYANQLLAAIGRGVVDELFAAAWYPYWGCALTIREVGWDEMMSSEFAVYQATRGALLELRKAGSWELCG